VVALARSCSVAGGARGAGERWRVGLAYDGTLTRGDQVASTMTAGGFVGIDTARPAQTPVRAVRQFLDWAVEFSRARYLAATAREGVRAQLHRFGRAHALDRARSAAHADTAPTLTLVRQLVQLWQAGASPMELRLLAEVPLKAIESLLGDRVTCLDKLDLLEQGLDGQEDVLQLQRRIRPVTPAALRDEAAIAASLRQTYEERERALLAMAYRLERGELLS